MKKPLLLAGLLLAVVPVQAGFAPADNPTITVFELTGDRAFTTDFDNRNVLTMSVKGRAKWRLAAKNTPIYTFDDAVMHLLPDGKSFWLRGEKTLEVRDVASGGRRFRATLSAEKSVQDEQLQMCELSPDTSRVALGGSVKVADVWTSSARVFDVRSGRLLQSFPLSDWPTDLTWTTNTRIDTLRLNKAAYDAHGDYIPGKEKKLSEGFDVALAPTSFVRPKLSPAGVQVVAAQKAHKTRRTSNAPRAHRGR